MLGIMHGKGRRGRPNKLIRHVVCAGTLGQVKTDT